VESPDQLVWAYAPGAIKISVAADDDLNLTGGLPAGLSFCLYQLSDNAWFLANSATGQGLGEILLCDGGKPGEVSATRYLVQPGQKEDLVIDRLAGAKYVAVAGGYSSMPAQSGAGILPVPVIEKKNAVFANTFTIEELDAWLLLKAQTLQFFPKSEEDKTRKANNAPNENTAAGDTVKADRNKKPKEKVTTLNPRPAPEAATDAQTTKNQEAEK
jgi:predicted component of type VI protein secretion system